MQAGVSTASLVTVLRRATFAITLVWLLPGCDNGTPASKSTTRRDSAGVLIVESPAPLWRDNIAWSVDSAPVLSIGVEDGDASQMFSGVTDALRLEGGRILIVDSESRQLRLFDSAGKLLKVAGRSGTGPGELRYPDGLAVCGDELWLHDFPQRMSVWSPQLEFIREFKTVQVPMWPLICFDSTILVKEDVPDESPNNTIYVSRLELSLAAATTNGASTPVAPIPLREYMVVVSGRSGRGFVHPFGKTTYLARDGDGIAMTGFDGVEIRTIGTDGKLRRIVRGPSEDLSNTPALVSKYRAAKLGFREEPVRKLLDGINMPLPESHPAFTDLRIDSKRNLWARRFVAPGGVSNQWAVFASTGEFLGDVSVPTVDEIFEIGNDYMLAHVRDSADVERVQVFKVQKGR